MRRLTWLIAIFVVLWSAWWVIATTGAQKALMGWIDDRQTQGWLAEVGDVSKHGFPMNLHLRARDLSVLDPVAQMGVEVQRIDLMTPTYWPGYMTLQLPTAPIKITTPAGQVSLHSDTTNAHLWLDPGLALGLDGVVLGSGPFRASNQGGDLVAAEGLAVMIMRNHEDPHSYLFSALVSKPFPGTYPREMLGLPKTWPLVLDAFNAAFSVTFDRPLDRSALGENPPQIRQISISNANVVWGDLKFASTGDISLDASGIPTGGITLAVSNWRQLILMGVALGVLSETEVAPVEIILQAVSNLDGNPEDLNIVLTFKDNQMALGPINLGPAPRLFTR